MFCAAADFQCLKEVQNFELVYLFIWMNYIYTCNSPYVRFIPDKAKRRLAHQ